MIDAGPEVEWPEVYRFGQVEVVVESDEIILTAPPEVIQGSPDLLEARGFVATMTDGPASYSYGPEGEIITYERTRAL